MDKVNKANFGKLQKSKLNKREKALVFGGRKSTGVSSWGAHVGQEDFYDGELTGHNHNINPTDYWVHWSGGGNSLYAN
jgi:hypothetical protein